MNISRFEWVEVKDEKGHQYYVRRDDLRWAPESKATREEIQECMELWNSKFELIKRYYILPISQEFDPSIIYLPVDYKKGVLKIQKVIHSPNSTIRTYRVLGGLISIKKSDLQLDEVSFITYLRKRAIRMIMDEKRKSITRAEKRIAKYKEDLAIDKQNHSLLSIMLRDLDNGTYLDDFDKIIRRSVDVYDSKEVELTRELYNRIRGVHR